MKKSLYMSILVMILLVTSLTLIGYNLNKKNNHYYKLEEKLTSSAKIYLNQFPDKFPDIEGTFTSEKLIEDGFLTDLNYKEEICSGYVSVKKNYIKYEYMPYIKCDNYQTKKIDINKLGE